MCHYKTLHVEENSGYVLQCSHCHSIVIGFNLLTFQLPFTDYQQMIRDIEGCIEYYEEKTTDALSRNIPLRQLNSFTHMTVSLKDLRQLAHLLHLSYGRVLVDQLLNELSN